MKKIRTVILALVLPVIVFGQIIEIDHTEIPQDIGTIWWENSDDSATVALGSTGGPQVWDFTSQPMGTDSTEYVIVDKGSTPYADSFPTANLTYLTISFSDATVDTFFLYQRLTEDSLNTLGGIKTLAVATVLGVFNPISYTPLSMVYNNQWIDNFGFDFTYYVTGRVDYHIHSKIDAYGTVEIPYGTYECLRVCCYDTMIITVPGILYDTLAYIKYRFIAENYGNVVSISSYEGGTDPNFTEGTLTRLTGFKVGVEERLEIRDERLEIRVQPNPFTAGVSIKWSGISEGQEISLEIYDLSGRLVKSFPITDNRLPITEVEWDGRDDVGKKLPAGIYFYQLRSGKAKNTGKIVLVR